METKKLFAVLLVLTLVVFVLCACGGENNNGGGNGGGNGGTNNRNENQAEKLRTPSFKPQTNASNGILSTAQRNTLSPETAKALTPPSKTLCTSRTATRLSSGR